MCASSIDRSSSEKYNQHSVSNCSRHSHVFVWFEHAKIYIEYFRCDSINECHLHETRKMFAIHNIPKEHRLLFMRWDAIKKLNLKHPYTFWWGGLIARLLHSIWYDMIWYGDIHVAEILRRKDLVKFASHIKKCVLYLCLCACVNFFGAR